MPDEPKRYRALLDLALRKSPDPKSPLYEEWHEWPAGTVFEAPAHLEIETGIAKGKFVEVGSEADKPADTSAPSEAGSESAPADIPADAEGPLE